MFSASVHVKSVFGWSCMRTQITIVSCLYMFGLNMSFKNRQSCRAVITVITLPPRASI